MAAICIEHMERKGTTAGLPVICWVRVQGLGRGQAAGYGAPCTNQAAEVNTRRLKEQHKAEAGAPQCSSCPCKNSTSSVLFRARYHPFASLSTSYSSHCGPQQCPGPPRRRHHTFKTTRRQVHLSIAVLAAYTTQLTPASGTSIETVFYVR
jgi:hypothetical protein